MIKLHNVRLYVKDGVGMGTSNRVSITITFTSDNLSPREYSTTRCHNFGANIIVSHFWCDFKVAMVRVNAVSISIVMNIFRRQILFIKISLFGSWS